MAGRLAGKIALVTGGAQGIGAATALKFAKEGAKLVAIADLPGKREVADGVLTEMRGLGSKAIFVPLDVSKEDQWEKGIAEVTVAAGGPLDVLVNNAGIARPHLQFETLDLDTWNLFLNINLTGTFLWVMIYDFLRLIRKYEVRFLGGRGIKHGIRSMMTNAGQDSKSIVNVSSIEGLKGSGLQPHYSASKGGVRLLSKSAAIYCARAPFPGGKIRVNSIHPGGVQTPIAEGFLKVFEEAGIAPSYLDITKVVPLARVAQPPELANVIAFVSSEEASYMTGSEVVVDGGWTA
ncbi:VPS35 endosomal protein sorting factor-like [Gonapodya sp. JEL0774]|nr:VPS35 endosomal protein sorting factor-like [Gonapodya sp. JEL0774]